MQLSTFGYRFYHLDLEMAEVLEAAHDEAVRVLGRDLVDAGLDIQAP